jgi:polysaccharide export outer membrane protein
MTLDQLNKLLTQKYSKYLVNPQLTVNLLEPKPLIVQVTGAVQSPGVYELRMDTKLANFNAGARPEVSISRNTALLSNVLVAAGGITFDADLEHVQVKNTYDHSEFEVDLMKLLMDSDASQDIYLVAGDSIVVPKLPSPLAVSDVRYKQFASASFSQREIPIKVLGFVNRPGLVRLNAAQALNINAAISEAGGYLITEAYQSKKVYLSRADANGHLVTRAINPTQEDVILMPNDIVYVPNKLRPLGGKFFDYTGRVFTGLNSIAGAYNNWALMFDPYRYQIRFSR